MKIYLMKLTFICLFVLSFSTGLSQTSLQPQIDVTHNMFRSGDKIVKYQINYLSPGDTCTHQIWDFSKLNKEKAINEHYRLKFKGINDSVMGLEHGTIYYYQLRHDSLLSLGYKNPTTEIQYLHPELLLKFPMTLGNQCQDYFFGKGLYSEELNVLSEGKSTTKVDADGIIILANGDTLKNVLRTHTYKYIAEKMDHRKDSLYNNLYFNTDSIDFHLKNDSVILKLDIYKWYVYGTRYPVFESIQSRCKTTNSEKNIFSVSFYYPIKEQYYGLDEDVPNQNVKDEISANDTISGNKTNNNKPSNEKVIIYSSSLNNSELTINYTLAEASSISFMVYDMSGCLLAENPKQNCEGGSYSQTLSLHNYYQQKLLLKIEINGEYYGQKFINP